MQTTDAAQRIRHVHRFHELIAELSRLRCEMLSMENRFAHKTEALGATHHDSARNLLHYLALRRRDIRPLQDKLASYGLSSLGRAESRVLTNLDAVLKVVRHLAGHRSAPLELSDDDFASGKSTLERNTELVGTEPSGRKSDHGCYAERGGDRLCFVRDLVSGGVMHAHQLRARS
jgi:pyruvate kinase